MPKNPVKIEYPSEEEMQKVIDGGVSIPVSSTAIDQPANKQQVNVRTIATAGTLKDAFNIMSALPAPDDIKQFKKVKKIKDLMKELMENDNA